MSEGIKTYEMLVANIFHDISNPITSVMALNDYDCLDADGKKEIKQIKQIATQGLITTLQLYYAAYSGNLPAFSIRDMIHGYLSYNDIELLDISCNSMSASHLQAISRLLLLIARLLKRSCSINIMITPKHETVIDVTVSKSHNTQDKIKKLLSEISAGGSRQGNLHACMWRECISNIAIKHTEDQVKISFRNKQ